MEENELIDAVDEGKKLDAAAVRQYLKVIYREATLPRFRHGMMLKIQKPLFEVFDSLRDANAAIGRLTNMINRQRERIKELYRRIEEKEKERDLARDQRIDNGGYLDILQDGWDLILHSSVDCGDGSRNVFWMIAKGTTKLSGVGATDSEALRYLRRRIKEHNVSLSRSSKGNGGTDSGTESVPVD